MCNFSFLKLFYISRILKGAYLVEVKLKRDETVTLFLFVDVNAGIHAPHWNKRFLIY